MSPRRRAAPVALFVVLAAIGCAREPDAVPPEPASAVPDSAADPQPLAGAVVVNHDGLPVARWGDDPYELETEPAPVVEDDALTLAVSYSGGCARHDVTLVADGRFADDDPVRLGVSLAHNDNGDRCEAYPTETYRFDLAPVRKLYRRAHGAGEGMVRLRLRAPERSPGHPDLIYAFESRP